VAPGPELVEFTFHVRDQASSRRLDDIPYAVRSLSLGLPREMVNDKSYSNRSSRERYPSARGSSDYDLRIKSPSNPCVAPGERLCEAKRKGLLRNQRKSPRIARCARHRRRRAEIVPSAMAETTFGELLRQYRRAVGYSQEGLAERAGLSVGAIAALEQGIRRAPHRDTVDAISDALGMPELARREFEAAAAQARRRQRHDDSALPASLTSFI
jgi:DNA-binding XRE family transcriptional regulator